MSGTSFMSAVMVAFTGEASWKENVERKTVEKSVMFGEAAEEGRQQAQAVNCHRV